MQQQQRQLSGSCGAAGRQPVLRWRLDKDEVASTHVRLRKNLMGAPFLAGDRITAEGAHHHPPKH
jgi:hypothetical protein